MLTIRLRPKGKKRQRTYRVVVDKKRSKLDGKFVEDLGFLNRHTGEFNLKEDRVEHWLSVGAQPSTTVHNLFVTAGLIEGDKKPAHAKKKVDPEAEAEESAPEEKEKVSDSDKEQAEEGSETPDEAGEDQSDSNEEDGDESEDSESEEDTDSNNEDKEKQESTEPETDDESDDDSDDLEDESDENDDSSEEENEKKE